MLFLFCCTRSQDLHILRMMYLRIHKRSKLPFIFSIELLEHKHHHPAAGAMVRNELMLQFKLKKEENFKVNISRSEFCFKVCQMHSVYICLKV